VVGPTELERQLYLSLKGQQCNCQYERDGRGVPVWDGIPLARQLVSRCPKCLVVDEFEMRYGNDLNINPLATST
jgi:hypothetical protein